MPATTTNLLLRKPLSTEAPDGAGQIGNLADDIDNFFGRTAGALANLAAGTRYGQRAVIGGNLEARWNGSAWVEWDSEWIGYTPTIAGVTVSTVGGQYRFIAGKVKAEVAFQASGGSSGTITASLPVNARQTALYTGVNSQSGWWANGRGNLYNGSDCDLVLGFNAANAIRFGLANSSRTIDTVGNGFAIGNGNSVRGVLEYDRA